MSAMVRNTPFRLSPANFLWSSPAISHDYKLLNHDSGATDDESSDPWSRITRNERSRHRQVFLRTYKLASADSLGKRRKGRTIRYKKLRKIVVKVKRLVIAMVSFARPRPCDCRSVINVSCPRPITRCF